MKKTEKQYHENGNIHVDSELNEKGERHGITRVYHENGQLQVELNWTNNIQDDGDVISYHDDGSKARQVTLVNHLMNGPYYEWHRNGQLKAEGVYNDKVPTVLKEWDENGVLIISEWTNSEEDEDNIDESFMNEAQKLSLKLTDYKKGLITKVSIVCTASYLGVFQLKKINNSGLEKIEDINFLQSRLSNYEFKWGSTFNKKNPFFHDWFYESKTQVVSSKWFFDLVERFIDENGLQEDLQSPFDQYYFNEFLHECDVMITSEGIFGDVDLLGKGNNYLGHNKLTNDIEYAVADELKGSDHEFLFE